MRCLSSAKMNMLADVLKPVGAPEVSTTGHWEAVQDPESGAIERVWVADDPSTPDEFEGGIKAVPVTARGVLNAGLIQSGTTENFNNIYTNIDWVKMSFPPGYNITQRDRVTNIRDRQGNVIWKEEDLEGQPPTVFNVMGITPVPGPFGNAVEYIALLKRAEVQ